MTTFYHDPVLTLGDVISVLSSVPDNHYDACLCDPPYLLEFMGKSFDKQHKGMKGDNEGQQMYQWHLQWCKEVFRVLKPGGFILAFGGTRTSHRLVCALEDVGFEIRDTIEYMYGSGFPKSRDISKDIDKLNGDERKVIGTRSQPDIRGDSYQNRQRHGKSGNVEILDTVPGSNQSALWSGYGTSLKPAHEPIILAMKPCQGTFAENALEYDVAGLNIDGSRVGTDDTRSIASPTALGVMNDDSWKAKPVMSGSACGRWPANLILSHHETCVEVGTRQVRTAKGQADYTKTDKQGSVSVIRNVKTGAHFGDENGLETIPTWECHPLCPVRLLDEQSGILIIRRQWRYRRLLIPFSGAGSEVTGAQFAGWDYVHGIESDPEYTYISHFRVKGAIESMGIARKSDVKVIHSSLRHVLTLGINSEFPGYPASIGVLLERSRTNHGIYLLSHAPKLSCLETGEMLDDSLDADDIDTRLRSELLSQADMCEKLSADLLAHAERLRSEARREALIHDSGEDSVGDVEVETLTPPGKSRAREDSTSPSDVDLGAFDD